MSAFRVFLDDTKFPGIPHDLVGIPFEFAANALVFTLALHWLS
jgi:hypothetical protein